MMRFTGFRPSTVLAAAVMAFVSGCASDRASGPLANDNNSVSAVVLGASSSYIVPGIPAGTFETFTANQIGRTAGAEFWDNLSDDGAITAGPPIRGCSIGFFATDRMKTGTTCINQTAGSDANAAGNSYTYMWSDGVKSAAFAFNGGTSYTVFFRGAYSGLNSVVGYYTKSGSAYTFFPVAGWSSKNLATAPVVINTGGLTWGFFIANKRTGTSGVEAGGCGTLISGGETLNVACSDATGGHVMNPLQQFALFANADGSVYLVGAEDKSVINAAQNDSDYNDYIWKVIPTPFAAVCDFMTFGRTQIVAANGDDVVISGNAGGNSPQGGILGNFLVKIGDAQYNLHDIASYGPITSGVFSGASYPNARVIVGTTTAGDAIEIRIYDGGEPGRVADAVYVRIGASTPLGAAGTDLDRGNIQYHANCRGPQG